MSAQVISDVGVWQIHGCYGGEDNTIVPLNTGLGMDICSNKRPDFEVRKARDSTQRRPHPSPSPNSGRGEKQLSFRLRAGLSPVPTIDVCASSRQLRIFGQKPIFFIIGYCGGSSDTLCSPRWLRSQTNKRKRSLI